MEARKAKVGFETIYNNAVAKLEILEAEAKAKVEEMIAEDKQALNEIIAQSSVLVEPEHIEEIPTIEVNDFQPESTIANPEPELG